MGVAMDTAWLEVFREVARRGSFTAAAKAMGYTQSAISRQVSSLESATDALLFDRLPRGVRLTAEGHCLLGHAEAVLDRLGTARTDLAALRDLVGGRLRIGAFPTADAALVPRAIAAFQHAHAKVALSLVEGLTPNQLAQLHSGDIDLAVVSTAPSRPFDTASLDLHHLLDDTMFVALPPTHPLVGHGVLRLAQLAEERWVAGRGRVDDTLLAASMRAGFRPRIELIAAEWIAKQGLVAAGLGITLVPSLAVDATRPDIALAPLHRDDVPARAVYAATLGGLTKPPAGTAFLEFLDAAAAEVADEIASRANN
ncbi:LysR family transcriptional regulator [Amycolatopsis minnesotensis]|uniref:LysR family transcriptional regulator n=1 Tax=Amycolatopsis minnesotensis TaxID=337894 RepID=A0ABN2SRU1_9PSEU